MVLALILLQSTSTTPLRISLPSVLTTNQICLVRFHFSLFIYTLTVFSVCVSSSVKASEFFMQFMLSSYSYRMVRE